MLLTAVVAGSNMCVVLMDVIMWKHCMLQVAEWTKAISVKWRELTAEQKETFQKMAANDKQRYMQQVSKL